MTFTSIPIDLHELIFTLAASPRNRESNFPLLLVSKSVYSWYVPVPFPPWPIKMKNIIFRGAVALQHFLSLVQSKPTGFFQERIRALFLGLYIGVPSVLLDFLVLIPSFVNLRHLYLRLLDNYAVHSISILDTIFALPLHSLVLDNPDFVDNRLSLVSGYTTNDDDRIYPRSFSSLDSSCKSTYKRTLSRHIRSSNISSRKDRMQTIALCPLPSHNLDPETIYPDLKVLSKVVWVHLYVDGFGQWEKTLWGEEDNGLWQQAERLRLANQENTN
ncbi:hypothetical protein DL96DRAFT_1600316 [Flagelloscypha sp. PMI_526]|nr:hypothetical protein DL96DRAFT_1600316 [Flagelloscypha sp. PMI_526]